MKNYSAKCKIFILALPFLLFHFYFLPLAALANGDDHGHAMGAVPAQFREENTVREGVAVNFNAAPPFVINIPIPLGFFVNEKPTGRPVQFSQIDVSHGKLIHVFGVRSDLNEFFHIHPRPQTEQEGLFVTEHIFNKPGTYKLWSEISKSDTEFTFGHPAIDVAGEGERENKNVTFGKNVVVGNNVVGNYQVALKTPKLVAARRETELIFEVRTATGQGVELENYIGAKMHLVVIKDDLRQFMHAHPAEAHRHMVWGFTKPALAHGPEDGAPATEPGIVNFHVTFPEKGVYRVFAQFRPQDLPLPAEEALIAAFWIQVEEQTVSKQAAWWGLLIGSLTLMVLLSLVVKKFIHKNVIRTP